MIKFSWIKRGKVFDPAVRYNCEEFFEHRSTWMQTYAQNPAPIVFNDKIRVYTNVRARRDGQGNFISRVGYVDLDRRDPFNVLAVSQDPVLPVGQIGDFDEFGTMGTSIVDRPEMGEHWMYYVGWTRKASVPYDWAIGLGRSSDGGVSFKRHGVGPVIGPTVDEPFLLACPHVRLIDEKWHMWYAAGIKWMQIEREPIYQIHHAVSDDGIEWQREGRPTLPAIIENECHAAPSVIWKHGQWYMFFSYRHGTDFRRPERGYRVGCAVSDDLQNWQRCDEAAGFEMSHEGWDSEMAAYPYVLEVDDRVLMFYSGNNFGEVGFGFAELASST